MTAKRECNGPCHICRQSGVKGAHVRGLVAAALPAYTLAGDWDCPFGMGPVKQRDRETEKRRDAGLGDTVARITRAVGIQPCAGCKERQAVLNSLVPYKPANLPPTIG